MANTDKDIIITPNKGQSADPKIVFSGANANVANQDITLNVYPDANGTLSFEGSAGQLFSITNDLTGVIFSVNDISGIPSIEVNADGTITMAEFSGNVTIGNGSSNALTLIDSSVQITGPVDLGAVGNVTITGGTNGYVLSTDGSGNLSWVIPNSGATGISGFSGFSGISGFSGFSGISGFSGRSGFSGWSGISGYSGINGVIGVDGATGATGISGFSGRSGFSGFSGISGFSGFSGRSGFSGFSGISGFSGAASVGGAYIHTQGSASTTWTITHNLGYQYVNVEPIDSTGNSYVGRYDYPSINFANTTTTVLTFGSAVTGYAAITTGGGVSGFSGISGFSGFSGRSGFSGYSGISGFSGSGISGYSGRSGFSGFSGISGFSGYSGISGYSGFSGRSGFSGFSGISGFSGSIVYPAAGIAVSTGSAWATSKASPAGAVVGTTDTQTLTNKTISFNDNTLTNVASINTTQTFTNKTLTSPTITGAILNDGYTEEVYALGTSGTLALEPDNGSIQTCALTGAPTFTDALSAGQSIVLMLTNGSSYTVTWPTMTWVTSAGNTAPTLTAADTLVFWKVSTTLYGAYVGSYV